MKKHSRTSKAVAAIILLLLALVTILSNVPQFTECSSHGSFEARQHWFEAAETVVEPWRGPHHVYGTFIIPKQYKFDHLYTARLMIHGIPAEFQAGSPEDGDLESGNGEPAFYAKRVYLSTRTAMWFMLMGQFGDLKASCHWWLVISDRIRQAG